MKFNVLSFMKFLLLSLFFHQNLVEDTPLDTLTLWRAYAPGFGPVLTGSLSRRVASWVIGSNKAKDVLPTQRV